MSDFIERKGISADLATRLVEELRRAGAEHGKPFVVAILDEGGLLKAFLRMDGARHISIQVAQDKAYTALSGRPTHLWHDVLEKDEVLGAGGRQAIDRLVTLGGGYPIVIDGDVIGAIGVAGGHYSEDMQVATTALAAVGVKSEW